VSEGLEEADRRAFFPARLFQSLKPYVLPLVTTTLSFFLSFSLFICVQIFNDDIFWFAGRKTTRGTASVSAAMRLSLSPAWRRPASHM
jgi:hypothetical protein